MRGGHWAASCTFLAEVAHKEFATKVAECGRIYGSLNKSQAAMFKWALLRELYGDVQRLIPEDDDGRKHIFVFYKKTYLIFTKHIFALLQTHAHARTLRRQ